MANKRLRELIKYAESLGYRAEGTRNGVVFVHKVRAVPRVQVHVSPSDSDASKIQRGQLRRGLHAIKCERPECTQIVPDFVLINGDGYCSRVCHEKVRGTYEPRRSEEAQRARAKILP